ncbi:MAG: DUF3365 domain-containing protein [Sneathiella sp.]
MTQLPRFFSILLVSISLSTLHDPVSAAENDPEFEIAIDLATMLRSARSVIGENQSLINDPAIGDKGLGGDVVQARALEKFQKTKGGGELDITTPSLRSRLLNAQIDAIGKVMDENQSLINQKGVALKGFVPAVFARLVNEQFQRSIGQEAEIKVTAPPELIRNRKARPDPWELDAIRTSLSSPDWKKGKIFSAAAQNRGRAAFRVLVPEYYGKGCLACHGAPKGELDLTGYPKEGGKLGDLGGAISVTLYRN